MNAFLSDKYDAVLHIVCHYLLFGASGGGATNSPPHVLYMGISHSRLRALCKSLPNQFGLGFWGRSLSDPIPMSFAWVSQTLSTSPYSLHGHLIYSRCWQVYWIGRCKCSTNSHQRGTLRWNIGIKMKQLEVGFIHMFKSKGRNRKQLMQEDVCTWNKQLENTLASIKQIVKLYFIFVKRLYWIH